MKMCARGRDRTSACMVACHTTRIISAALYQLSYPRKSRAPAYWLPGKKN